MTVANERFMFNVASIVGQMDELTDDRKHELIQAILREYLASVDRLFEYA
jgi:hypothetical protein